MTAASNNIKPRTIMATNTRIILICKVLVAFFTSAMLMSSTIRQEPLNIEIITSAMMYTTLTGSIPFVGPAFDTALEEIRVNYPYLNITQKRIFNLNIRSCLDWSSESDNAVAKYFYKTSTRLKDTLDMIALVCAGCNEVHGLSLLATQWNMLFLTSVAGSPLLRHSPTWVTTTVNSFTAYSRVYRSLAQRFNWTSFGGVVDYGANPFHIAMAQHVQAELLETAQTTVDLQFVNSTEPEPVDYKSILRRFKQSCRVVLYFGDSFAFRKLLIEAHSLDMTNGEFVYICTRPIRHPDDDYIWYFNDSSDQVAKGAFQSLLVIEPEESPPGYFDELEELLAQWKYRSMRDYNNTYELNQTVNPNVVSTYSAMMMFAQVIDELRATDSMFDFTDGTLIAKQFANRTFAFKSGNITLDQNGERIPTVVAVMVQHPHQLDLTIANAFNWPGPWPVPNEPRCGFQGESNACLKQGAIISAEATAGFFGAVAFLAISSTWIARRTKKRIGMQSLWWKLDPSQLELILPLQIRKSAIVLEHHRLYKQHAQYAVRNLKPVRRSGPGVYKGVAVWVTGMGEQIENQHLTQHMEKSTLLYLNQLKSITHDNINLFLGLSFGAQNTAAYFVSVLCSRDCLCHILETVRLDPDLQISFLLDLLQGTACIHRSALITQFHGKLSSWSCLVDGNFTLKIGGLGYRPLQKMILKKTTVEQQESFPEQFYAAPEVLRNAEEMSAMSDVYSVAIVANHILTMTEPFYDELVLQKISPEDVVDTIRKGQVPILRPRTEYSDVFLMMTPVVEACWNESPHKRPSVKKIILDTEKALGIHTNRNRIHAVERVLDRLGRYADELDEQVYQRTEALLEERHKCDLLLQEMLPRLIIDNLRLGKVTPSEMFESITVMFTEISGFQELLKSFYSVEVMDFLNKVYSVFDASLPQFDVYKVETIKDSYMVASGLPVRNGDAHVREICSLAWAFLLDYRTIPTKTEVKIGIHTGPSAAGVVGLKAPRYCLFGDTVNTASRMLLYGSESKIHLSDSTTNLLTKFSEFQTTERGTIFVKGKGQMATAWLINFNALIN